jgi:nucleotide-binding universal stress UspA family protein
MTDKTILVPIDFSEPSKKALEIAAKLAKKISAKLLIVNASLQKGGPSNNLEDKDLQVKIKEAEQNSREKFETLKESIQLLKEVDHTFIVRYAFLQEAIISMTSEYDIDLIIMGTNEVLIGNNSYAIAREVNCPVLVIPHGADVSKIFTNIGLAGDYKKIPSKETFQILTQIARVYNADIHVVHVSQSPAINPKEIEEAKKLDRYFKELNHDFSFKFDTDLDDGLNKHIEEKKIGLLAIVKRRKESVDHVFNCSNTEKYTNLCKIPFLILNTK